MTRSGQAVWDLSSTTAGFCSSSSGNAIIAQELAGALGTMADSAAHATPRVRIRASRSGCRVLQEWANLRNIAIGLCKRLRVQVKTKRSLAAALAHLKRLWLNSWMSDLLLLQTCTMCLMISQPSCDSKSHSSESKRHQCSSPRRWRRSFFWHQAHGLADACTLPSRSKHWS